MEAKPVGFNSPLCHRFAVCVITGKSFNLRWPQLTYLLQKGVVMLNYCQVFRNLQGGEKKKGILFRNVSDLSGLSKPSWWC